MKEHRRKMLKEDTEGTLKEDIEGRNLRKMLKKNIEVRHVGEKLKEEKKDRAETKEGRTNRTKKRAE